MRTETNLSKRGNFMEGLKTQGEIWTQGELWTQGEFWAGRPRRASFT